MAQPLDVHKEPHGSHETWGSMEATAFSTHVVSDASGPHSDLQGQPGIAQRSSSDQPGESEGLAALRAVNEMMYQAGRKMNAQPPGAEPTRDHSHLAQGGAAPVASEAEAATQLTLHATDTSQYISHYNNDNSSTPQAPWSKPPLGIRRVSRTRNNLASTMEDHSPLSMDALFVTPKRASAKSTNPTPYHSTPSTSTRKRKAGVDVPPLHIPTHSHPEQFATPVQAPPSAGIFGSQARSLRGGQRRTVQADQFSAPPQEVLAQLQEIPQLLQDGMSQLTQIIKDLARKHNALEKRVQELERENRVLKGQPSPPTPIQRGDTMPLEEEMQAPQSALEDVYMDVDPRPRKKRSKNAIPMPGEAYGGPLYTQPNKSPVQWHAYQQPTNRGTRSVATDTSTLR